MPALTFNAATAKISLSYDGLTIYPLGSSRSYSLALVITSCLQLSFIQVPNTEPTLEKSMVTITKKPFYNRQIHINDNDHFLYHQSDEYDMEDSHYHFKFTHILSKNEILILANVFESEKLFTAQESDDFKQAIHERFNVAHEVLETLLNQNKAHDLRAINQFVLTCTDNDLLADLHAYLLSARFNYLRQCDGFFVKKSLWRGTAQDGSVVETSKTWAMVEKAITLQLAANIRNNTKSSAEVVAERAGELSAKLPFFSIARRQGSRTVNHAYTALSNGDKAEFESLYTQHFSTYTK